MWYELVFSKRQNHWKLKIFSHCAKHYLQLYIETFKIIRYLAPRWSLGNCRTEYCTSQIWKYCVNQYTLLLFRIHILGAQACILQGLDLCFSVLLSVFSHKHKPDICGGKGVWQQNPKPTFHHVSFGFLCTGMQSCIMSRKSLFLTLSFSPFLFLNDNCKTSPLSSDSTTCYMAMGKKNWNKAMQAWFFSGWNHQGNRTDLTPAQVVYNEAHVSTFFHTRQCLPFLIKGENCALWHFLYWGQILATDAPL